MVADAEHMTCGAILLPGIPVFPNNAISLHIFEPRYRQMLKDSKDCGNKFAIGSLPSELNGETSEIPLDKAILVEVVVNQELPDGRSILIVSGVQTIRVLSWEQSGLYPKAIYEEVVREVPSDAEMIRSLLVDSFEEYLQKLISDEKIRRFLLEENSDRKRASELLLLLEEL